MKRFLPVLWATALTLAPGVAFAAQAQKLDTGNTAWILTSTALVLFMTLPGLSLFYGGLVRAKNVLSVLMQCFTIACAVSIVWLVVGYSLVFEAGNAFIGGLGKAFFAGVGVDSLSGNIPETVFAMFQLTFAIITPALIVGSFAERMRFSALLIFSVVWVVVVYAPVAHWVWGGGWLGAMGALDFAGGTVVHINSGIAALVAAMMIGQRHGFPNTAILPHNLPMAVTGAGILWVGLVRLQRRQRAGGRRRGGHGHARDPHLLGSRRPRVDVRRMDKTRKSERTRHRHGHGGGPRRHHAGIGLRGADGRAAARRDSGPGLLRRHQLHEAGA